MPRLSLPLPRLFVRRGLGRERTSLLLTLVWSSSHARHSTHLGYAIFGAWIGSEVVITSAVA